MSEDFQNWACAALDLLGLPDGSVIIQYLEPLDDVKEVRNYLNSMLDPSNSEHREFIEEFLERQALSKVDKRFYRKSDIDNFAASQQVKKKVKDKTVSNGNEKTKNKKKESSVEKENFKDTDSQRSSPVCVENGVPGNKKKGNKESGSKQASPAPTTTAPVIAGTKKKTKFVNLYTTDGNNHEVVMESGRKRCECLASDHRLINNCLVCGRIVCEQEGAGPCMFCDSMVLSKNDETTTTIPLNVNNNNKQTKLNKKASVKDVAEDIERAVSHKNKLLEYDRTSEKRTKVLDDECDYFETNSKWLSKEQNEILVEKEKEFKAKKYDRRNNVVNIDLLGRKVVVDESNVAGIYDPDDPVIKAILEPTPGDIFTQCERNNQAPPQQAERPLYVDPPARQTPRRPTQSDTTKISRLQDGELHQMGDQGRCLSMHQPWASLLIAGIKKHEGRTWYSPHRGRLWIASAAKVATADEIRAVEEQYEVLYRSGDEQEELVFPQHYPPGVLLGSIDVTDVLPQDEYRTTYPRGESDSPYVFVCQTPQEMFVKFQMKGKHKIFQLDSKLFSDAKKALKL